MISRIWHGWTTAANANAYESLLKSEIFIGIKSRQIAGYRGIQLLRRSLDEEVEFVTVMWFDTIDSVEPSQAMTMKWRLFRQVPDCCFHALIAAPCTTKLEPI